MGEFGGVEMTYLKKLFEAVKFLNSMEKQNKKIMITFHNKKVHFLYQKNMQMTLTMTNIICPLAIILEVVKNMILLLLNMVKKII